MTSDQKPCLFLTIPAFFGMSQLVNDMRIEEETWRNDLFCFNVTREEAFNPPERMLHEFFKHHPNRVWAKNNYSEVTKQIFLLAEKEKRIRFRKKNKPFLLGQLNGLLLANGFSMVKEENEINDIREIADAVKRENPGLEVYGQNKPIDQLSGRWHLA